MDSQVREAASVHIGLDDVECDAWQVHRITPAGIRPEGRSLLDLGLSKAEQLRLAERGALYAAACPSFACRPVAFVVCPDGSGSCRGLIHNFLPITCIIPTF